MPSTDPAHMVPGIIILSTSHLLSHLTFINLGRMKYDDAHFTDEENEAWRSLETNP